MTKDELRAELERQAQRYKDVYGGEVITYAAQPDPDRKPWRKPRLTAIVNQQPSKFLSGLKRLWLTALNIWMD